MVICFAPDCNHRSERETCSFFRFPVDRFTRNKWREMCRRADRSPAAHSRLCSCHFVDGKKDNGPTVFQYLDESTYESITPQQKFKKKRLAAGPLPPPPDDIAALVEPRLERKLQGHNGMITGMSFDPNGKQLVTSSSDFSLMIWNTDGQRAYRYLGHSDVVTDVCFAPYGRLLASSSADKTVRIWDSSLKEDCAEIKAHLSTIRSVHFSPDSSNIVTASDDKSVKVWSTSRRKFLASYHGHTNWVRCARFSSDGKRIASASDDKSVRLYDRFSGLCFSTFRDLHASPLKVEFHPGDTYLAVGLSNGAVSLYDLRDTRRPIQFHNFHTGAVNSVFFHSTGNYLVSASADSTIKVIDLVESRHIYTIEGHEGAVTSAAFSVDGRMIASGGEDKMVVLWRTSKELLLDPDDPDPIMPVKTELEIDEKPKSSHLILKKVDKVTANKIVSALQANSTPGSAGEKTLTAVLQRLNTSVEGLTQSISSLERRMVRIESEIGVRRPNKKS